MASKHSRSRGRRFVTTVHKPHGVIQPRVQQVGPEHFGIVSVDCAKARFKWMLCDFYGTVLIPPTVVEHYRPELDFAVSQLQRARQEHELRDLIVAVERTGRYHHVPQRLFAAAGCEVRLVHPFTSKQHRQATDPGVKTDDTDLAAIHRAAVNGCALCEAAVDPLYRELQLLIRQRRDWVRKTVTLCCQIREYLHSAYPGYVACFATPWHSEVLLALVRRFESAAAMIEAGVAGLTDALRQQSVRFQRATLETVLAWARQAPRSATPGRRADGGVGTPGSGGTIESVRGRAPCSTGAGPANRERLRTDRGKPSMRTWRSLGSPTPDTAAWGHSPDVPAWRDGDRFTRERVRVGFAWTP